MPFSMHRRTMNGRLKFLPWPFNPSANPYSASELNSAPPNNSCLLPPNPSLVKPRRPTVSTRLSRRKRFVRFSLKSAAETGTQMSRGWRRSGIYLECAPCAPHAFSVGAHNGGSMNARTNATSAFAQYNIYRLSTRRHSAINQNGLLEGGRSSGVGEIGQFISLASERLINTLLDAQGHSAPILLNYFTGARPKVTVP